MYTVLELFAGAGGMALGLKKAGLEPVALVELDSDCIETLRTNFADAKVLQLDLSTTTPAQLMSHIDKPVDILTGGVPCQPFSIINHNPGFEDVRSNLFYNYVDIVNFAKPKLFMIENVKNLTSQINLKKVLDILNKTKYNIYYKVLNAKYFGVPQRRQRVFIVGVRPDVHHKPFKYPQRLPRVTVLRDAILDMPPPNDEYVGKTPRPGTPIYKIMKALKPGQDVSKLGPEYLELYYNEYRKSHKRLYEKGYKATWLTKRACLNDISETVVTSGRGFTIDYFHPVEDRYFTINEIARIQSFPDSHIFVGKKCSRKRQIGNAVPPELAYHMGCALINYLNNDKSDIKNLDLFDFI